RTTHADVRREIALSRQPVARPQLLALDQAAHVRDDLPGAALTDAFGPPAASMDGGHKWNIQSYTVVHAGQNRSRRPICMSRGLFRSWLMNPNVAFRGFVSGFQSTV